MRDLGELLKAQIGEDFPVGSGNAKRDDPLVITARRNYVAVEYEIAKLLLGGMGLEYELEKQQIHRNSERVVDELVYATKEPGQATWTETRRFFFDITVGYYMIHSESEESTEGDEPPSEDELRRLVAEIRASAPQSKKNYDLARKALIEESIDSQIIAARNFNRAALIIPLLTMLTPLLFTISWGNSLMAATLACIGILLIRNVYLFTARRRLTSKSASLSKEHYQRRYK